MILYYNYKNILYLNTQLYQYILYYCINKIKYFKQYIKYYNVNFLKAVKHENWNNSLHGKILTRLSTLYVC